VLVLLQQAKTDYLDPASTTNPAIAGLNGCFSL